MSKTDTGERNVRLDKLSRIREAGVHPYPDRFDRKNMIEELLGADVESLRDVEEVMAESRSDFTIAGRVMLKRGFGKLIFGQLKDQSGSIQFSASKAKCEIVSLDGVKTELSDTMTAFKFLDKLVDRGDFIGITGELFLTHKGELTLFVKQFQILSKALLPLPEKFHGLEDQETKYRKRYLDMIANQDTFDRMVFRSRFTQKLREFYFQEGFIEVETPVLDSSASGALADPFLTHHKATDSELFLRIAPELPLKKCTIGGMEKVFEIAKNFRNEGLDPSHLPEFTAVEHYAVYWNYEDNMDFTEKMIYFLLDELKDGERVFPVVDTDGTTRDVDFSGPWPRVAMRDLILQDSGIDIYVSNTLESLRTAIIDTDIKIKDIDKITHGTLIDKLYKAVSRPKLIDPVFVTHQPIELSPLARKNDENPAIVDRYQLVINGWEVNNAFSEIVDPVDQASRFATQQEARESGDDEAMMKDDSFVTAMEYGMPIQSGYGMGIDRMVALLTGQPNLRDVVLFPMVKGR